MATARFPHDFTSSPQTDYMLFEAKRRVYTGEDGQYTDAADQNGTSKVILYMPQKITESQMQMYRNTKLGPEASALLRNTGSRTGVDATGPTSAFSYIKRMLEGSALNTISSAMAKIGSDALDENSILSATSGIIYNPMMEVLYDGPQFRTFNYQFMLFAKSDRDAEEIYKIIRFFQFLASPSKGGVPQNLELSSAISTSAGINAASSLGSAAAGAFTSALTPTTGTAGGGGGAGGGGAGGGLAGIFTSLLGGTALSVGAITPNGLFSTNTRFITQPPQVNILYQRGGDIHPYIDSPQICVLQNINIDYTPTGNYTVLNNLGDANKATTVATTVTLSFTEAKIKFAEDYYN